MTDTLIAPHADMAAYAVAYAGAVIYDGRACGRIWMRGQDAAALLHRLSTNQIEKLTPGQGARTVLATPIGRIIDLLTVHRAEDGLLLVTSPGNGPMIFRHLRKNIFFNDKVTLEDASERLGQLMVYGPQATVVLAGLGLPAESLTPYGMLSTQWRTWPIYLANCTPLGGGGIAVYASPEALAELSAALADAGIATLDHNTFDVLRVEAGHGAFGREISLEYIPLEANLGDAISFTKGCYVGHEIIVRMQSRGRLAKQLRGLHLSNGLADDLALPMPLIVEDKDAGELTSIVDSPRHGMIGLAYVRSAYAAPGGVVEVGGVSAEIVALPFE